MEESMRSANPKLEQSLCEECRSNTWKYRCPGCSIRTCSLPCVKSHKHRTGCSGQKSHAEVVPLSKFDDNLLLSDYNFLEEAKRLTESARRGRSGIGGQYYGLPMHLKALKAAAHRRGTNLVFQPYGMSRRMKNQSHFSRRNNSILWTIEWRFHSTDVKLIDHGVDEHTSIQSAIGKHLTPSPWNHQLRPFCIEEVGMLKFFLQKKRFSGPSFRPLKSVSRPLFRQLKVHDSIGRQMKGVQIFEYPVIHVYLPTSNYDFEVEKFSRPIDVHKESSPVIKQIPSPKGKFFREEEINEEDSSETMVMDLLQTNPATSVSFCNEKQPSTSEKAVTVSDIVTKKPFEDPEFFSIDIDERWKIGEDTLNNSCEFDFEQDLKDAYTDLVRDANPDDFLCFDFTSDGEKTECEQMARHLEISKLLELDGELEEGEIP